MSKKEKNNKENKLSTRAKAIALAGALVFGSPVNSMINQNPTKGDQTSITNEEEINQTNSKKEIEKDDIEFPELVTNFVNTMKSNVLDNQVFAQQHEVDTLKVLTDRRFNYETEAREFLLRARLKLPELELAKVKIVKEAVKPKLRSGIAKEVNANENDLFDSLPNNVKYQVQNQKDLFDSIPERITREQQNDQYYLFDTISNNQETPLVDLFNPSATPQIENAETGYVYKIKVTNEKEYYKTMAKIEDATDDIFAKLINEPNEFSKAQMIFDWVRKNVNYPKKDNINMTSFLKREGSRLTLKSLELQEDQNISFIIGDKTAVCDGYTDLVQYLANKAGIKSMIVYGYMPAHTTPTERVGHAWNIFIIDGVHYIFDATQERIMVLDPSIKIDPDKNQDYTPMPGLDFNPQNNIRSIYD